MSENKKMQILNNERICIIRFLDKFLTRIENNIDLDSLNIVIIGDHGSKAFQKSDALSPLLIYRDRMSKYNKNEVNITIQKFFKDYFN